MLQANRLAFLHWVSTLATSGHVEPPKAQLQLVVRGGGSGGGGVGNAGGQRLVAVPLLPEVMVHKYYLEVFGLRLR